MQTMPIASCSQRKFFPSSNGGARFVSTVMDPPEIRLWKSAFSFLLYWYAVYQYSKRLFSGPKKEDAFAASRSFGLKHSGPECSEPTQRIFYSYYRILQP